MPSASKSTKTKRQAIAKKKPAASARKAPAKRRSAEDILARIMSAASEEFEGNGYSGATTAAIARRAEVTEAQLFRYFSSKSELFAETVFKPLDQHFLNFVQAHLPEIENPATHSEQFHLYTTELQRFIRKNAGMFTSLVVAQTYGSGTTHGMAGIKSLGTYFDHGAAMMAARNPDISKTEVRILVRVAFATVQIGRAVQQECRDRSRMPSSA
eukprot:TRINITY_DN8929_c0_g1_i2.p1 TRINITY_DN8929_c0_g1~~TRINITY_DN8929_c0_g1_i2.p1  ORF type:complete len:213 (+),score=36.75 TRINITY_DN8929_c0_g1_i2:319-957(+)